jgi:uncharacterized protein YoxC
MSDEKVNNFYFSGLGNPSGLNSTLKDNDSLKFIVIQNDTLHSKVESLSASVSELNNRVNELEDDNDKLDKNRLALRSYLKNETIHTNLYKTLCGLYNQKLNATTKRMHNERFLTLFTLICFFNCLLIDFKWSLIIYIFNIFILISYTVKTYKNSKISNNDQVALIKKEIEDLVKGNNLLDQLIDNL